MATKIPGHDAGAHGIRSMIGTALLLLGIDIAVFLAMAGIVHVLSSHDASAAIAGRKCSEAEPEAGDGGVAVFGAGLPGQALPRRVCTNV